MKKYTILGVLTVLFMIVGLVRPLAARAEHGSLSGDVRVSLESDSNKGDDEDGDSDKNKEDDQDNDAQGDDQGEKGDNDMHRGFLGAIMRNIKNDNDGKGTTDKVWSGIVGKVTAIDATKLTVASPLPKDKGVIFTVDASAAVVYKDGATTTPSGIAVNDMIVVEGSVSGTTVTATKIIDGLWKPKWVGEKDKFESSGDPVVGGTVTAISGSTITIKNKAGVTYTIDASTAKFGMMNGTTKTIADVHVGDNLLIQGPVSNTSVTAKLIIDSSWKMGMMEDNNGKDDNNNGNDEGEKGDNGMHRGFFVRIGTFFGNWFHKK
jgi:preprotein translocase subunit YajC